MKIIFLDRRVLQQPSEIFDYSGLVSIAEFSTFESSTADEIIERSQGADILMFIGSRLDQRVVNNLGSVKFLAKAGTGLDTVDLETVRSKNLALANVPGYGVTSVSEWTMSLMLMCATKAHQYAQDTTQGKWREVKFTRPVFELRSKTLGIIGYGLIGRRVAELAQAFGMKVLVHSKYEVPSACEAKSLASLLAESDFVSIHCLLDGNTLGLIGKTELSLMKPSSYLINTARAGIIDRQALYDALSNQSIAGAAMDVLWDEPPEKTDPFLSLPNVIITPHVAWGAHETRQLVINEVAKNIQAWQRGEKRNRVL